MFKKMVVLCMFLAAAAWLPWPSGVAVADEGSFTVEEDNWVYRKGGRVLETPVPCGAQYTERGWIHWIVVNPAVDESLEGERPGIHLFEEMAGKYSFLSLEEGATVNSLHFSPDGERFIVMGEGEEGTMDIPLTLFTFDDLKAHFKTMKAAMPPLWVDIGRFAYSRFEGEIKREAPEDYPDQGVSLIMYDVFEEEETVLRGATETSSFYLLYFDEDGNIVAEESWVESPEDWADPENKVGSREVTVEVPAAG